MMMRRGRSIALIALFVLAGYDFSVRPLRLVESFKALRCCSEHGKKSGNMGDAERCCGVAQDQGGLRSVHAASPDLAAAAAVVLPGQVELPALTPLAAGWTRAAEPPRAPPIFLAQHAFLL